MATRLSVCLLFATASAADSEGFFRASIATTDPKQFIDYCHSLRPTNTCTSYACFASNAKADLRQMSHLRCQSDSDCIGSQTGLRCRNFENGGFCDCPNNQAYDPFECKCKEAELCWFTATATPAARNNASPLHCHNGMRCSDRICSCSDLTGKLYTPHNGFCVLPRTTFDAPATENATAVVIIAVFGAVLGAIVVALCAYMLCQNLTCEKGEYECDDVDETSRRPKRPETHVAAWDLPSLDYLSEDETGMKYLKGPSDPPSTSTASPSPGGSLPECERTDRRYDNDGYDSEDQSRYEGSVDV